MPKHLYHYTDASSLNKIANSGVLRPSTGPGDAALGNGVYFTSKPPQSSNSTLLNNNYDGAARGISAQKVEAYVRVDASKVNAVSGVSRLNRDVWVVPTNSGLDLSKANPSGGYRKRY